MKQYRVTPVDKPTSNKFANLSFIFALVVVFIHVPHVRTSGMVFLKDYIPGFLQSAANPWFMLAAGFFFVGHADENGWWHREITKRVRSLIVPFLIINAVMTLLQFAYQGAGFCYPVTDAGAPVWKSVLCAMGLYPGTNPPINGPTWFIRTLFLYALTMPLFFPLLHRIKSAVLFLSFLYILGLYGWDRVLMPLHIHGWDVFRSIYNPGLIFYFLLGVCLRFHGIPKISVKMAFVLLLLGGGGLAMYAPMDGTPRHGEFISWMAKMLSFPLLHLSLFTLISSAEWPKVFTNNAFPIYILHWQLITAGHIICGKTGTFAIVFGIPMFFLAYWLGVVGLTLLVAVLIRRSKLLERLVLGGR